MGEITTSPARRCLSGFVGCHYPAPHDHVAGAVYPHPSTCDCCWCISGARIEGGQLVVGGKDAPEAALRARVAALETQLTEAEDALRDLMVACGEGGNRGRAVDLIPYRQWERAEKLCREIAARRSLASKKEPR